jgi:hypothetical protein
LLLSWSLHGLAQKPKGEIHGVIMDSATQRGLSLATISVYSASDTSLQAYTLADEKGKFKLSKLPTSLKVRIVITHTGFKVFRKLLVLNDTTAKIDLGTIFMNTDTLDLETVIVTAERPPVTIRNDTIEFNANSFKTLPNAVLEDLLKKLPGVDVNPDGTLYARGKPVNRILVDGKRFFANESSIALKNLPANIIDKVQITDDKEQLRRNPDINPAEVGQVINFTLKNGIKKGYFGKAYAGTDLNDHNETGVMVNTFKDTFQVSIIGYENNVNKPGFASSDVQTTGGFLRNSRSSTISTYGSGYSINGISLGGTGEGLQKSLGGGLNLNTLYGKHIKFNTLYFFGSVRSDIEQTSNQRQLIQDTALSTLNKLSRDRKNDFHKVGSNLEWEIDSSLTLTFTPEFNYKTLRSTSNNFINTSSNFNGQLNDGLLNEQRHGRDIGYSHNVSISKLFRNRRRNLTINHSLNTTSASSDAKYLSDNYYYTSDTIAQSVHQSRLRERPSRNIYANTSIHYSEPMNSWLTFSLGASNSLSFDKQSMLTYDDPNQSGQYSTFIDSLSNEISRHGMKNSLTGSMNFRLRKGLVIGGGSNLLWIRIKNANSKIGPLNQRYFYSTPIVNIRWKDWTLNYDVSITEPYIMDLQTVVDNSNALYQQVGNPDLLPSQVHRTILNYFKYDFGRQMYYSLYVSGEVTNKAIVRERFIDDKGVQISRPVNVSGLKFFTLSGNVNFSVKMPAKWRLQCRPAVSGSYSENVTILNGVQNRFSYLGIGVSPQFTLSYGDFIEVTPKYSISYRKSNRSSTGSIPNDIVSHSIESSLKARPHKRIVFESTLFFKYNPSMNSSSERSVTLLNGSLSFLCLKDYRGEIKLSVNDLLNQNANIYRYISENYIVETVSNSLKRYVMLSFLYNLRHFKGK